MFDNRCTVIMGHGTITVLEFVSHGHHSVLRELVWPHLCEGPNFKYLETSSTSWTDGPNLRRVVCTALWISNFKGCHSSLSVWWVTSKPRSKPRSLLPFMPTVQDELRCPPFTTAPEMQSSGPCLKRGYGSFYSFSCFLSTSHMHMKKCMSKVTRITNKQFIKFQK